jgi:hypothetical protein
MKPATKNRRERLCEARLGFDADYSLTDLVWRPLNRAAMVMSEPAIGVAGVMRVVRPVVLRVVLRVARHRGFFRESQRPRERNHRCGKSPNN